MRNTHHKASQLIGSHVAVERLAGQVWWCLSVIPALGRQFEDSLGYIQSKTMFQNKQKDL
jgi:hypothetical protein